MVRLGEPRRLIRTRQRKGHFNEVYFLGMARNMPHLTRLVAEAPIDDLELLDRPILMECLERIAAGVTTGFRGIGRLDRTLSLLNWLSNLERWEEQGLTPTVSVQL